MPPQHLTVTRGRAIRLAAGLLMPVIFLALLELSGDATRALAITEGLPLAWVIGYALRRRRIEPVGAAAVAGFGIALLLTIALGGSPLPLELHRALFPGAVGLACLVSLAAGRPLLEIARRRVAMRGLHVNRLGTDDATTRRTLVVLTAIIGATTSADAAAQIALAFAVSPATFGVVARIAAWVIIGSGLSIAGLYLRRAVRDHR